MELIRDLRRNGLALLVKVVVVVLLALALYDFGTFVQSSSSAVDKSLSASADVDVYTVLDTFQSDPGGFESFRADRQSVAELAAFVDGLDHLDQARFITAFDQPLSIVSFRGGDRFDVGYGTEYTDQGVHPDEEGRPVRDVKTVQLNQSAFRFAGLKTADGGIDWDAVRFEGEPIPVILGSDYRGVYGIGDEIDAAVLLHDERLVVAGFLEPDSSMYFRGDLGHFLDDTVVVPYPERLAASGSMDPELAGMMAFQMLNGDLAVDRGLSVDDVLDRLDRLGNTTGFHDYSITGIPTYVAQLSSVRQIIRDNLTLLTWILVLLVVAAAVVIGAIDRLITRRRVALARILWEIGRSERMVLRTFTPTKTLEYLGVVTAFAVACAVAPNQHGCPYLAVCAVLAVVITVDSFVQRRAVRAALHAVRGEGTAR